ncbi:MAG: cytochrome c [Pararhodobacter sp.]|nr:cytochrome c [Pararhodobacter sp.]
MALAAAVAAIGGTALFWVLGSPRAVPVETLNALAAHDADAARGERVFWAAGCSGCHAAPGLDMTSPLEDRLVLSGGRRLESPFGIFVVPNVSMDDDHGLGGWTLEEFAQATLAGISPLGRHYYPAFPYTSYNRMTPGDLADLWAFWQTLPADATPSAPHELRFPFTLRRGVGLWKRLNLTDAWATPEPPSAQLQRGRYLVEALSHCTECHTPRNATGALRLDAWMTGAPNPSGDGSIPAIPAPDWSAQAIAAYLQSGLTPAFDVVGGSMSDVVVHMQQLPADDREAIAAYLVWLRDG